MCRWWGDRKTPDAFLGCIRKGERGTARWSSRRRRRRRKGKRKRKDGGVRREGVDLDWGRWEGCAGRGR